MICFITELFKGLF